jgi:hypothetical protein
MLGFRTHLAESGLFLTARSARRSVCYATRSLVTGFGFYQEEPIIYRRASELPRRPALVSAKIRNSSVSPAGAVLICSGSSICTRTMPPPVAIVKMYSKWSQHDSGLLQWPGWFWCDVFSSLHIFTSVHSIESKPPFQLNYLSPIICSHYFINLSDSNLKSF